MQIWLQFIIYYSSHIEVDACERSLCEILKEQENNGDGHMSTNLIVVRKIHLLYTSPMT